MKGSTFRLCLFVGLCLLTRLTVSVAQSITVGPLSASAVCAGSTVSVPFTTVGVYASGNVFTAQISDINGSFSSSFTTIGQQAGSPAIPSSLTILASIPSTLAPGSAYKVRVVSSNPPRTSLNTQSLTVKALPPPPATASPPPYCEGATASPLSATASAGGTLNWYGSDPGSIPSTKPTTPSTSLVGSTAYYVSQTVNGCEGPQASITVVVKDSPNAPGTSPKSYCVGESATPLSATPVAGASLNWYTVPAGGTASPVAPTPSTTSPGSTTYYASQTLNDCESPRAALVVTVNSPPPAPAATTPTPTCQGSPTAPLTATAVPGATLRWWGTNASGGTYSTTATIPNNQSSDTYYVSQERNGCDGPRTAILVTIKPRPAPPATAPAPAYCQSTTATPLSATASTGGTLNWYGLNATGGTASTTPSTPNTNMVGINNYYVSQTVDGCEGPRAAIAVQVKPTPTAPITLSPTNLCQNRPASPLSAIPTPGGTLNWYGTNKTGGTPSATAPTPPTSTIGTSIYYVSQSINGCEGPRASTSVIVYAVPARPTTTPPSPYCEGTAAAPLMATGQSLRWYGTNETGGTPSTTPTTPGTGQIGTQTYYVTQTVNGCESDRSGIPVVIKDTPDAPAVSGSDFCQSYPATSLSVRLVDGATANWYATPTGGTPASDTPTVPNTDARSYTYYASQTLDGCESPRGNTTVRVKATPATPTVSPVSFCNNGPSQQLVASGSGGNTIRWYDVSNNPLNGAPIPPTNSVGLQVYKASQVSGEGCESLQKASLLVTIKALPVPPGVANLAYCQSQPDQPAQPVGPLQADGQGLRWYTADGVALPTAPTPPTSRTGVTSYQVSQTVDGCEGGRATIQVSIGTSPAPTVAKSLLTYCLNDQSAPLQATAEPGGRLQWVDPYGRVTDDPPTPPTLNVNVQPGGDVYYVYQVGANGCYSARSAIRIVVNAAPTLALLGAATINLGQRTPIRLNFTGSAPFSYTLTGGYMGTVTKNDTVIQVLPRGNTTYQVIGVANGCGLGLPGNPATAVIVVRVPTITTSTLATTTLCAGTTLSVPFTTTGSFTSSNLFSAELISATDTTVKYTFSATTTGSPALANLPTTLPGGRYYVRAKASNPDVGITGSNSPTTITVLSRPAATLTGTQQILEGTPANLTIAFGGAGPWKLTYTDSVRIYSVTTTANPYIAEVRPARTTTYRLTEVSNNCGTGPLSGTATIRVLTVLGLEDPSLGPLVNVYPVPSASTITVDIDASLSRSPAVLSLINQRGQPVIEQSTQTRQTQLDLSNQPSGLYLLRIQLGDRQTTRKIIKQ